MKPFLPCAALPGNEWHKVNNRVGDNFDRAMTSRGLLLVLSTSGVGLAAFIKLFRRQAITLRSLSALLNRKQFTVGAPTYLRPLQPDPQARAPLIRYLAASAMPPKGSKKNAVKAVPAADAETKVETTVDADPALTKSDTKRKRTKPAPKNATDSEGAEHSSQPTKKPRATKKSPKPDPFHADTLATHPPRLGTTTSIPMTHLIGAHTSTSGGPEFALVNASELGANALAMFLKNQRRWESKGFEETSVETWKRMMKRQEEGGELSWFLEVW